MSDAPPSLSHDSNSPRRGESLLRRLVEHQSLREAPHEFQEALAAYDFSADEVTSPGLPGLRAAAHVIGTCEGQWLVATARDEPGGSVLATFRDLLVRYMEHSTMDPEQGVGFKTIGRFVDSALGAGGATILEDWATKDGRPASQDESMVRMRHDQVRSLDWWPEWIPTALDQPPAEVIAILNAEYQWLGGLADGDEHPDPLAVEAQVRTTRAVIAQLCATGVPSDMPALTQLVFEAARLHLLGMAADGRAVDRLVAVLRPIVSGDPALAVAQLREQLLDQAASGTTDVADPVEEEFAERELEMLATATTTQALLDRLGA